jgi:hypothetical protein
MLGEFEYEI